MKRLFPIITLILLTISCSKTSKKDYSEDIDTVDSLNLQIAILKKEIEELKTDNTTENSKNENFQDFLFKFMTDSVFQIKRVDFPLTFIHWKNDYPGNETDTVEIAKSNWKHEFLYFIGFSSIPQLYDNFEMKLRPTNDRLLHFTGVETGTDAKYFFKAIDNKWFLTRIENLGD